jgi:CheY-like chemotaxis protein
MFLLPDIRKPNLPAEMLSRLLPDADASRERLGESSVARNRARILLIGDDPILQYSRRLILERDGYIVASLRSNAVQEESQLGGFDLVILCHSVPDQVAGHILEVLWRITPQTPVLLVSRLDKPISASPHQIVVAAHPVAILGAVALQLAIHERPEIHGQT